MPIEERNFFSLPASRSHRASGLLFFHECWQINIIADSQRCGVSSFCMPLYFFEIFISPYRLLLTFKKICIKIHVGG